jgi:hypothetical protein
MAVIMPKKPTKYDPISILTLAILKIAKDDNHRLLLSDECDWQQVKLREIARLRYLLVWQRWEAMCPPISL